MLDQGFAALHAHLGPGDRFRVQGNRDAEDGGAAIGIRPRHEFAQFAEAVADLADDVFIRDEAILENHLGIVGQALAHLVVHAADGEAGAAALEQKAGGAFRHRLALFGLGEKQEVAGAVGVGNEVLHAVDDPAALGLHGGGAERRCKGH